MNKKNSFFHLFLVIVSASLLFSISNCNKEPANQPVNLLQPGVYDVSVQVDTLTRWFKIVVPTRYDHMSAHPLLLAYHGANLSMSFMYNERKDLVERCEQENWILVFPNGANDTGNRGAATWHAIHCCKPALSYNIDDIGFTEKIIDTLRNELNIDPDRIYAIGGSNGGMFVHRVAADLPDIFAAVAENQGTIGGRPDSLSELVTIQPKKAIPILMIHGINDQKVKFFGGITESTSRYDLSFEESVLFWAHNNGCEQQPDTTIMEGLKGKVYVIDFDDCEQSASIRAIAIENKGHGWPGLEESGFDGTNASIDFLKIHSK